MVGIVAFPHGAPYFKQAGEPRKGTIIALNKGGLNCHGLYEAREKVASDLHHRATVIDTPSVLSALWNRTCIADTRRSMTGPWPMFRAEDIAAVPRVFLEQLLAVCDVGVARWGPLC
jgi:hypothetical protein